MPDRDWQTVREALLEEKRLERFRFTVTRLLGDTDLIAASNLGVEHYWDTVLEAMVLRLHAYLTSEVLQHVTIRYPKDWWQAFKEHWFPNWLLKKFPVVYHVESYDVRAFYPHVFFPDERHFVRIIPCEVKEVSGNA